MTTTDNATGSAATTIAPSTATPARSGAPARHGGPGSGRAVTQRRNGFARDAFIVFRRQLRMNLRNPAWVLIGIMQPVLYLVLFGPLLKPLTRQFGAENAYTFLVPGLLVQLGVFGSFFAGFSLIGEWREGVIEAERVTPASRVALLTGRLMRDLLQLLVQSVILIALGFAMGMKGSLRGAVIGVLITLLVGGACAAASNALALSTKSEDVMAPVINMVMMPVMLLSGILLPMTLGPKWLHAISDFMPFRHVVDAVRTSFVGHLATPEMAWGVGFAVVMFVLAMWWGTSTFRRENA